MFCGKTGHSATRCPTLDVSFPFILPDWKAEKTSSGYLMISPKMATDRRRVENPLGSVRMLDPTTRGGGGGTTGFPDPRNVMKMDITKSPTDIVENRNVKPMQVSSQVAEKASSDGTTNKQCRAAHRQSTKMTVIKVHTDFADIPKPTLSQGLAVAAEEARTVGTVNVQCRSDDQDYTMTTVVKSPTDFVKITESTPSRVSPVVAKKAHTDGTRVVQCQSDDQNFMKTTIIQMPWTILKYLNRRCREGF